METKKTTMWVVLAVLLTIMIVGILVIKAQNKEVAESTNQEEQEYFEKTIDVKHQYKNGKHIFAGTIEVPTPCYQVEAKVAPGDIAELNITTKDNGGICAQVITDANFYVEFNGKKDQLFKGNLNGEPANLNTFEIEPDLDINDIEIFMKG